MVRLVFKNGEILDAENVDYIYVDKDSWDVKYMEVVNMKEGSDENEGG